MKYRDIDFQVEQYWGIDLASLGRVPPNHPFDNKKDALHNAYNLFEIIRIAANCQHSAYNQVYKKIRDSLNLK